VFVVYILSGFAFNTVSTCIVNTAPVLLTISDMDPNNNNTSIHDHSKHTIEEFANRWWIWEILASIISLVLLASIFVIFNKYDNESLDAWPVIWKINSVVGFITTIVQVG